MIRVLFAFFLFCSAAMPLAPAWSHAVLLETVPADRAIVARSPAEIVLRFNEAVLPIAVRILDGAGQPAAVGAEIASVDGDLRVRLAEPLPDGAYILSYRITSEDSHPVSGSVLFAIGQEPAAWRAPEAKSDSPYWAAVNAVNRALHLAGLLTLAGGVMFLLLFSSERLSNRRALAPLLTRCAGLAALTGLLTFGLQGAMLADAPFTGIFDLALWRLGVATTRGTAALLALTVVALLVAAVRIGRDKRAQKLFGPMALAALVCCVGGFVVSGHAATAQPRWLTVPALALHVAIAAVWIGSFAPLLRSLARDNKGTLPTLQRFSRGMSFGVPLLIMCGLAISAVQLQGFAALASSRYGGLLLVKLLLVALLVAIAANNKFRLTPKLANDSSAKAVLRLAIGCEIALGLAILSTTALLSQTIPPRSFGVHAEHDHASALPGYSTVAMARGRMALIAVDPAVAGRNLLGVRLSSSDGRPLMPLEVSAELRNDIAGIEPITRRLDKIGDGYYRLVGPDFALSGSWNVKIEVLISDYEKISFAAAIPIAR